MNATATTAYAEIPHSGVHSTSGAERHLASLASIAAELAAHLPIRSHLSLLRTYHNTFTGAEMADYSVREE
jgi:hypothetical protein